MSLKSVILQVSEDKWKFLISLIVAGFTLYSIALNVGFFSDDYGFIEEIHQNNWSSFGRNFGDKFFIPVSHFIGFILYKVSFGNAFVMHSVQVLVHIIVSFQIYLLIKELGLLINKRKLAYKLGAMTAFIFLIHPFQTEAVVWLAAKSYGYSLLFSLMSVRYLFRNGKYDLIKSMVFLFIAINCKESAYFIPLTVLAICGLIKIKYKNKWFLGWGSVILISLLIRYLVLGEWIGGYGSDVHLPTQPMILLASLMAYGIKFLVIVKLSVTSYWQLFIVAMPMLMLLGYALFGIYKPRATFWVVLCLITLLLPVWSLELTSLESVSTDRYSYFALTAFSFGLAYVLLSLSNRMLLIASSWMLICFVGFNLYYQSFWRGSAHVRDLYLSEIESHVFPGENVMIVNIPDRVNGVYCLKNAPEDYMRIQGVNCNIEFYERQNLSDELTGISLKRGEDGPSVFLTRYPDENWIGRRFFNEAWLTEFDKVFIYQEGKLIRITEEYLKTVSLMPE